jgi:hypothetical protein
MVDQMREAKGKITVGTVMNDDIMLIVILLDMVIGDDGRPKGASIDVTWGDRLIIATRGNSSHSLHLSDYSDYDRRPTDARTSPPVW